MNAAFSRPPVAEIRCSLVFSGVIAVGQVLRK